MTLLFFSIINFRHPMEAKAAWTDNAIHFYTQVGENKAKYNFEDGKGYFYFGQRGRTRKANKNYYRIMGFDFTVTNNGKTYSAGMDAFESVTSVYPNKRIEGEYEYTYDLWKFSLETMINHLKRKYPGEDFSFFYNKTHDTLVEFNGIVVMYNYNGDNLGNINRYGETAWGKVIRSWNDANWTLTLSDGSTWTPDASERRALYGIEGNIAKEKKPEINPAPWATIIEPNRPGWPADLPTTHYHKSGSNEYWVNLKDRFSIYAEASVPKDTVLGNIYPDYNYVMLQGNGTDNKIYAKNKNNNFLSQDGFSNNFTDVETAGSLSNSETRNYLVTHFRMRAKEDNKDYKLSYASVYNGSYDTWRDSGQWLKTDGTAPKVTFNSNKSENVWTKDDVNVKIKTEDTRSGVKQTNTWLQTNEQGWVWQGNNINEFKLNTTGVYDVIVEAIDNVNNSTGHIPKRYLIDKAKPLGKLSIENVSIDGFDVVVDGLYDEHSGLDKVTLVSWTTTWNGDGKWQESKINNDTKSVRFRVNTKDYAYKFGTYNFDVRVFDKAGNELFLHNTIDVPSPKPVVSTIEIHDYEYKDNDIYWVRANDEYKVKVFGHVNPVNDVFKINSLHALIRRLDAKDFSSFRAYDAYIPSSQPHGIKYHDFSLGTNTLATSTKLYQGSYSVRWDNGFADSYFNLLMPEEEDIKISPMVRIKELNLDSDWYSNSAVVKSDGTAPIVDSIKVSKQTVNELNLDVKNLRDLSKDKSKSGSGVDLNNFYVEFQPVGYNGDLIGVKEKSNIYTSNGDNNYTLKVDWNSCKNKDWYGKFKVQVYVKDNVGNTNCIFDKVLDRQILTIQGVITPNPAEQGRNTTLTIRTEGSAIRIKAAFPDELVKLTTVEDPLVIEKKIKVEPTHTEILKMRVPLDAPITLDKDGNRVKEPYKVYIEAENGYGEKIYNYLDLDVQANILDNLKVRLRSSGYDKEQ